jgi:hypothetical protein
MTTWEMAMKEASSGAWRVLGMAVPTVESGYLYACMEGPCVDARRVDWSRADHAPKKGGHGERGAS